MADGVLVLVQRAPYNLRGGPPRLGDIVEVWTDDTKALVSFDPVTRQPLETPAQFRLGPHQSLVPTCGYRRHG